MNTAIQDGHNLAWKLAFVAHGWAGDDLLDSYEVERRPGGRANAARSAEPTSPDLDVLAIDIGVTYESGALVDDGVTEDQTDASWRPTGRPGARLPHVWLDHDGEQVSTLDLLGPGLTVFTGPDGARWRAAAGEAGAGLGVTVRVRVVGGEQLGDPAGRFTGVVRSGRRRCRRRPPGRPHRVAGAVRPWSRPGRHAAARDPGLARRVRGDLRDRAGRGLSGTVQANGS